MRVALVHDWLTGMRGGEWVLDEISRLFPDATLYTLVHRRGSVSQEIEEHEIQTSWLQHLSFGGRYWRYLLPLMPAAIESFTFPDTDLVVSTSHCVAKWVIPPPSRSSRCHTADPDPSRGPHRSPQSTPSTSKPMIYSTYARRRKTGRYGGFHGRYHKEPAHML